MSIVMLWPTAANSQFHPVATRACLFVALVITGAAAVTRSAHRATTCSGRGQQRDGSASAFVEA
jgi:hypothetical protein